MHVYRVLDAIDRIDLHSQSHHQPLGPQKCYLLLLNLPLATSNRSAEQDIDQPSKLLHNL